MRTFSVTHTENGKVIGTIKTHKMTEGYKQLSNMLWILGITSTKSFSLVELDYRLVHNYGV